MSKGLGVDRTVDAVAGVFKKYGCGRTITWRSSAAHALANSNGHRTLEIWMSGRPAEDVILLPDRDLVNERVETLFPDSIGTAKARERFVHEILNAISSVRPVVRDVEEFSRAVGPMAGTKIARELGVSQGAISVLSASKVEDLVPVSREVGAQFRPGLGVTFDQAVELMRVDLGRQGIWFEHAFACVVAREHSTVWASGRYAVPLHGHLSRLAGKALGLRLMPMYPKQRDLDIFPGAPAVAKSLAVDDAKLSGPAVLVGGTTWADHMPKRAYEGVLTDAEVMTLTPVRVDYWTSPPSTFPHALTSDERRQVLDATERLRTKLGLTLGHRPNDVSAAYCYILSPESPARRKLFRKHPEGVVFVTSAGAELARDVARS